MSGEFVITPHDEFIHVTASGTGTLSLALEMWSAIAQACKDNQCYKILGEQNLSSPLSTKDAYKHFEIFQRAGIGSRHLIAWVDPNLASREVVKFIGHVVSNRLFTRGRIFSDRNEAEKWLTKH